MGPEDNPRDDEPIDQQEYEKWEASQMASSPQIKAEWIAGWHARDEEVAAKDRRIAELEAQSRITIVEATQWFRNGDHPLDYAQDSQGFENGELRTFSGAERKANKWEGGIVRYFRRPDVPGEVRCQCGAIMDVHGWIDTLEGGHTVCPGDWIITGIEGEHYPCKQRIFAAMYERAAEPERKQKP